jgi:hypothetical protein
MRMVTILQNAIKNERVVLVRNNSVDRSQTCNNLRTQFRRHLGSKPINKALNFESYDKDRLQFMHKIIRKSVFFLDLLENEDLTIIHYNYFCQTTSITNSKAY